MFVVCCVGRGLCDGLITRLEESYWLCVYVCMGACVCACVCVCVWFRNLKNEAAWARFGLMAT